MSNHETKLDGVNGNALNEEQLMHVSGGENNVQAGPTFDSQKYKPSEETDRIIPNIPRRTETGRPIPIYHD